MHDIAHCKEVCLNCCGSAEAYGASKIPSILQSRF